MVKSRRASLPAEDKGLRFSGRSDESIGNPIAVDITRVGDGKSESSILVESGSLNDRMRLPSAPL